MAETYAGLDVSDKATHVCVTDATGAIVWAGACATDPEAIGLIVEKGFDHLVVDLPSVDRMFDEGKLSNHRLFWNVEPGKFEVSSETRMRSTITELAFVPEDVLDGLYFLNLQIAPFVADASPSRPLLYRAGMS